MDLEFNNAGTIDTQGTGWFVGYGEWAKAKTAGTLDLRYIPRDMLCHSLCMKWMFHQKGDLSGLVKPVSEGRTVAILVSNGSRMRLHFSEQETFPDGRIVERVLEQHGQFAAWGPGIFHRSFFDTDCTTLTLRWTPVQNLNAGIPEGQATSNL